MCIADGITLNYWYYLILNVGDFKIPVSIRNLFHHCVCRCPVTACHSHQQSYRYLQSLWIICLNNYIRRNLSEWNMPWWRHQMETFSALLAFCVGISPVPGEFTAQRPVTRSFGVLFDLRLNKQLSKQSWGWWFETLSRPLWRHRNSLTPRDIGQRLLWTRNSSSELVWGLFWLLVAGAETTLGLYSLMDGRLTARSREVLKPWGRILTFLIALTFDRYLDSSVVDVPVKIQSNTIIIKSNLAASRLHGIWR